MDEWPDDLPPIDLQRRDMQIAVGFGVVGGFFMIPLIYRGLTSGDMTEDERKTRNNVLKFVGGSVAVYGLFNLLDLDREWLDLEKTSAELEKKLGL